MKPPVHALATLATGVVIGAAVAIPTTALADRSGGADLPRETRGGGMGSMMGMMHGPRAGDGDPAMDDMARMHQRMMRENPEMARMHEQMMDEHSRMARMHEQMMDTARDSSRETLRPGGRPASGTRATS